MNDHRFILEPYSGKPSRYNCPSCEKKNNFTRYIGLETQEYLDPTVGICNRRLKCGYHLSPKDFFAGNPQNGQLENNILSINRRGSTKITATLQPPRLHPTFIDEGMMKRSLKPPKNNFLKFISQVYNEEAADYAKERYKLGTAGKWKNAVVFWQIDNEDKIRTGKIMHYNPSTGKRKKYMNWVHTKLKIEGFNLVQCLFGLHLINESKTKSIAIVESEKTAVLCSLAFPEYIWLATGGLNNLKTATVKPLKNRHVTLFPDAGCYDLWKAKMEELPNNIHFQISDLIEKKSTEAEKEEGMDIADYILRVMQKTDKI